MDNTHSLIGCAKIKNSFLKQKYERTKPHTEHTEDEGKLVARI